MQKKFRNFSQVGSSLLTTVSTCVIHFLRKLLLLYVPAFSTWGTALRQHSPQLIDAQDKPERPVWA